MEKDLSGGYRGRFARMSGTAQGAAYVSLGSLMLVVMASVAKFLGDRIPSFELLFFRSALGMLLVIPFFLQNPLEPFRTKRFGMHFLRGFTGAVGNGCFFWTITHMLLADSMALQFSRPLWMIPLAIGASPSATFFTVEPKLPMSRSCRWNSIIRLVSAETPLVLPQVTSRPPMAMDSSEPAQVLAPTCSNTTSTPRLPVTRRAMLSKRSVL